MAPWFASPTLFCWMKSMCTARVDAGALWDCLLTSRILRLVMRAGFQPATSLFFLKHDWYQSSSETSFTGREAGSTHGSSVCQEHFGAWGKITLALVQYTAAKTSKGAHCPQQGWRRSSWCLQSPPGSLWSPDDGIRLKLPCVLSPPTQPNGQDPSTPLQ